MKSRIYGRTALMRTVLVVFSLTTVLNCAGLTNSVKDVRDIDVSREADRVYAVSVSDAKEAVRQAFDDAGLLVKEDGDLGNGRWYLIGKIGMSWASNGQLVRVELRGDQDRDDPVTELFYVSRKRIPMNVTEDLTVVRDKLLLLIDDNVELL